MFRGTPFGSAQRVAESAPKRGLEFTLHPRGRPRKSAKKWHVPFCPSEVKGMVADSAGIVSMG